MDPDPDLTLTLSLTLTNGSGFGSGSWIGILDPELDTDPAIFATDLQNANKKLFFFNFSAYYFLKVHLHHFSKIKRPKELTEGS
jgi:hypothetical protein